MISPKNSKYRFYHWEKHLLVSIFNFEYFCNEIGRADYDGTNYFTIGRSVKILEKNIESKKINDFLSEEVNDQKIEYLAIDAEGIDFHLIMDLNLKKYDIKNISIESIHLEKVQKKTLVSKLLENGYSYSGSYGLFLPDISTILLNAAALDDNSSPGSTGTDDGGGINIATNQTANTAGNNPQKLFLHVSGSVGDSSGNIFKLNSQETITSDFVFVRARNSEFNYSENPSFISGSTGEIIYDQFI